MKTAIIVILSSLVAFFSVKWVYFKVLKIAKDSNIVDNPDARKLQKRPVPVLGGIAVFFGLIAGVLTGACLTYIFSSTPQQSLGPILCAIVIMIYTGALDDILGLTPSARFVVEIFTILALIFASGACIDSFHVIQQVNNAFNNIRVRVMKSFETTSEEYQLLKRFNWVLMKNSSRIDLYESIDLRKYYYCFNSQYVTPRVMIDKMLSWSFELNAAYSMKEEYAYINATSIPENAERRIDNFIAELFLYDVRELTRIARMLRHWKAEIINSFDRVNGQRISNGPIESVINCII